MVMFKPRKLMSTMYMNVQTACMGVGGKLFYTMRELTKKRETLAQ
jgi:hypothetical protein